MTQNSSSLQRNVARFALGSACSAHFFHHVYTTMLGPLIPLIRLDIPINYLEIGFLGMITALTITITQILLGPITDRFGSKIMILFSILVPCGGFILSFAALDFWWLVGAQLLIGIGGAAYHPAGYVLIKSHYPSERRGRALAIHSALGLQGSAFIPIVATALAYWLSGWRTSFLLMTLPSIIVAFIILLRLKNHPPTLHEEQAPSTPPPFTDQLLDSRAPQTLSNEGQLHASKDLRPYILPLIVIMFVSFSRISAYRVIIYFGATFIVDVFHIDFIVSNALLTLILLAGSIVNLMGGWLADHLGRRNTLILSNAAAAPAILWMALSPNSISMIFALFTFAVVFFMGSASESAYLADIAPIRSQAAIFGIVFSVETGVASFTLYLVGALAQVFGLRNAMLSMAVIIALGIIAAYFMQKKPTIPFPLTE